MSVYGRETGEGGDETGDGAEPMRTVRCVMVRDFSDAGGGRGWGDATPQRYAGRKELSKESLPAKSNADTARLKNHLEWKRQKEAEYAKKKEAERAEEERRKEEQLREEKEKRQREKEKEEKIKEWQEQKLREKEEKRREEMVLKALEEEIKGVTQTLDKEKLIREWMRLKNKQKQIESKKKAELTRREEESRALRQSLAEISYRQWKERSKNKRISLPKNGYQIFGPKPAPVVKEDWNHDFGVDDRSATARTLKSTLSMSSIRGPTVSRTDLGAFSVPYIDLKKRSPSICQLKTTASRASMSDHEAWKTMGVDDFKWKEHSDLFNLPFPDSFHDIDDPTAPCKLDIYLQPSDRSDSPPPPAPNVPKKANKTEDLRRYLDGTNLGHVKSKLLIDLNEKLSQVEGKPEVNERDSQEASRVYDKHRRKFLSTDRNRNRSLSITVNEKTEARKQRKSNLRRKSETGTEGTLKAEVRWKGKKAQKAEVAAMTDSPYCAGRGGKAKAKPTRPRKDN